MIAFANGLSQKLDWGESNVLTPPGRFKGVNARAVTMLLVLAAVWGSSYLFIKIGIEDGLSPAFISFARLALGALVLVPVAARSGALRGLRGHGGTVAFLGAVQLAGPFLLITIGERWISSSLAGILVASAPIFIAFLALWRVDSEERSAGRQLVGVGTGMAGVALLLGIDVGTGGLELIGALFVLLASLAYAVGALVLKRRLGEVQPVAMAAGAVSAGAAYLLLPAALPFRPRRRRSTRPPRWSRSGSAAPASRSCSSTRSSRRSGRRGPRSLPTWRRDSPCSTA